MVTFAPERIPLRTGGDPKQLREAATTATFRAPGEYILRAEINDESGDGGGGDQCCWTTAHARVTSSNQSQAELKELRNQGAEAQSAVRTDVAGIARSSRASWLHGSTRRCGRARPNSLAPELLSYLSS